MEIIYKEEVLWHVRSFCVSFIEVTNVEIMCKLSVAGTVERVSSLIVESVRRRVWWHILALSLGTVRVCIASTRRAAAASAAAAAALAAFYLQLPDSVRRGTVVPQQSSGLLQEQDVGG